MILYVTRRARLQIDRAAQWWDFNRDLAPRAFDEDIGDAFALLRSEPGIGTPVGKAGGEVMRRLHLGRIRYHLYYRIRGNRIEVLALWHMSRDRGPPV